MPDFAPERRIECIQLHARLEDIKAFAHRDRRPIAPLECCVTGRGRGPERMPAKGWKPFQARTRWGGLDETHWFRMTAALPAAFKGETVVALFSLAEASYVEGKGLYEESGEALAYVNGVPTAGIDRNHGEILLTRWRRWIPRTWSSTA